jgi:hypothetical protein
MVAYFDPDHAGADHRKAARQLRQIDDLVGVEHASAVERHVVGTERPRAAGDQDMGGGNGAGLAVRRRDFDLVRPDKARFAGGGPHQIAAELMFEHLDLVIECFLQAYDQVLGSDVLLHPVGAAVKPALAPAGQIEHGFAQRFGRDRSGMHGNAADPAAFFNHQHRLAEFGKLHGGAAPGRAGADHQHVIVVHQGRPEGASA